MQLSPLPNPYYLTAKLRQSAKFVDNNRNITALDLPRKWVRFWRYSGADINNLINFDEIDESNPSLLQSLLSFSHIYQMYYRQPDFADFSNFVQMYSEFQLVLAIIHEGRKQGYGKKLPEVRLFDLNNFGSVRDEIELFGRNFLARRWTFEDKR